MNVALGHVTPDGKARVELPRKFLPLLTPSRYKASWGGRGSAKSHSFARALLTRASYAPYRWLCAREIQKSIRDSVKRLLDDLIWEMKLTTRDGEPFWDSLETEIRGANGSLLTFAGLRTNVKQIKSMEGLDGCWVEEADTVSQASIDLLIPTIRKGTTLAVPELWFSWNPDIPKDPVDAMFRGPGGPPPDSILMPVSWRDNPYFPDVLEKERRYDSRDPDKYAHVWEGDYRKLSGSRVFKNWRVAEPGEIPDELPPGTELHFGADWGFSVDPSVIIRSWIEGKTLYVDYEAYGVGVDIDYLPALFAGSDRRADPRWVNPRPYVLGKRREDCYLGIPGVMEWPIRADSARPDTIAYMRRRGFKIYPARKGPGSVEEGIEFLQSFEIVVHPRCHHTIQELSFYSWKVDEHTGEVLPILADKDNHVIDSLRYSHESDRRSRSGIATIGGMI